MKILLAEDDVLLGEAITIGLKHEGVSVDWFKRGDLAEDALNAAAYDAVVLDIGLPGRNGLDVLNNIRRRGDSTPVLLLTALGSITDRVSGLDLGADDYLVKPFDMDELLARLRALARRANGRSEPTIEYEDICITPAEHRVEKAGQVVALSRHEYLILCRLIENCGRVYSQQMLGDYVHQWNEEIESNAVQVHIHHLRKKLGKSLIKTRRGIGYVIEKHN